MSIAPTQSSPRFGAANPVQTEASPEVIRSMPRVPASPSSTQVQPIQNPSVIELHLARQTDDENSSEIATFLDSYSRNRRVTFDFTPEQIAFLESIKDLGHQFEGLPLISLLLGLLLSDYNKMEDFCEKDLSRNEKDGAIQFLNSYKKFPTSSFPTFEFYASSIDQPEERDAALRETLASIKRLKLALNLFVPKVKNHPTAIEINRSFQLKISIIDRLINKHLENPNSDPSHCIALLSLFEQPPHLAKKGKSDLVIKESGISGQMIARPKFDKKLDYMALINHSLITRPQSEFLEIFLYLTDFLLPHYQTIPDMIPTPSFYDKLIKIREKLIKLHKQIVDPEKRDNNKNVEEIQSLLSELVSHFSADYHKLRNECDRIVADFCAKNPGKELDQKSSMKVANLYVRYPALKMIKAFLKAFRISFCDPDLMARWMQFYLCVEKYLQIHANLPVDTEKEQINELHRDFRKLLKESFDGPNRQFHMKAEKFLEEPCNFHELKPFCSMPISFDQERFVSWFIEIQKKQSRIVSKLWNTDPQTAEEIIDRYQILSLLFTSIPLLVKAMKNEAKGECSHSIFDEFWTVFSDRLIRCLSIHVTEGEENFEEPVFTLPQPPKWPPRIQASKEEEPLAPKPEKVKTRPLRELTSPPTTLDQQPAREEVVSPPRPKFRPPKSVSLEEMKEILSNEFGLTHVWEGSRHTLVGHVPVPRHPGKKIATGTVYKIIRQAQKRICQGKERGIDRKEEEK